MPPSKPPDEPPCPPEPPSLPEPPVVLPSLVLLSELELPELGFDSVPEVLPPGVSFSDLLLTNPGLRAALNVSRADFHLL